MTTRVTHVDKRRFGPWGLVTGASSGIGRAIATQLGASGINVVLASRRMSILDDPGRDLAQRFRIQYRSRFGADKTAMGRLMMPADICAAQGLAALAANRAVHISGQLNRATVALTPRRARIRMFGAMNRSMANQFTAAERATG
jgi:short-subunit dehydrogenase